MIREGWARLVTTGTEVLEQLTDAGALLHTGLPHEAAAPTICELNLTENQKRVLACLSEPRALDQLAGQTGLAIPTLQADLTVLQIRGLIVREDGQFRRQN
jgi:predicted Rossmann fold nucleotide-binding protein DprA/Smf involved in DNA uptake